MNRVHIERYRYRTCVAMLRAHLLGSEPLSDWMLTVVASAVIGHHA